VSKLEDLLKPFQVSAFGVTNEPVPISFSAYAGWVKRDYHKPLSYLADHRLELRSDLRQFYPDFKQAIVFLFSYSEERAGLEKIYQDQNWNGWKIASYALGFEDQDYHFVLKKKLISILDTLKKEYSGLEGVLTLDVHPVLERDLAYRSGLGWFGKNSMLIHQGLGSFVMIGSLLLNQEIQTPTPRLETDHCGNCRACLDICPTDAINEAQRTITAEKCISTFTIELFKEAPVIPGHLERGTGEIFGCDLCQDVCPWNKKPLQQTSLQGASKWANYFLLRPRNEVIAELENFSQKGFRRFFAGSVFERLGKNGLLKNLKIY